MYEICEQGHLCEQRRTTRCVEDYLNDPSIRGSDQVRRAVAVDIAHCDPRRRKRTTHGERVQDVREIGGIADRAEQAIAGSIGNRAIIGDVELPISIEIGGHDVVGRLSRWAGIAEGSAGQTQRERRSFPKQGRPHSEVSGGYVQDPVAVEVTHEREFACQRQETEEEARGNLSVAKRAIPISHPDLGGVLRAAVEVKVLVSIAIEVRSDHFVMTHGEFDFEGPVTVVEQNLYVVHCGVKSRRPRDYIDIEAQSQIQLSVAVKIRGYHGGVAAEGERDHRLVTNESVDGGLEGTVSVAVEKAY